MVLFLAQKNDLPTKIVNSIIYNPCKTPNISQIKNEKIIFINRFQINFHRFYSNSVNFPNFE